ISNEPNLAKLVTNYTTSSTGNAWRTYAEATAHILGAGLLTSVDMSGFSRLDTGPTYLEFDHKLSYGHELFVWITSMDRYANELAIIIDGSDDWEHIAVDISSKISAIFSYCDTNNLPREVKIIFEGRTTPTELFIDLSIDNVEINPLSLRGVDDISLNSKMGDWPGLKAGFNLPINDYSEYTVKNYPIITFYTELNFDNRTGQYTCEVSLWDDFNKKQITIYNVLSSTELILGQFSDRQIVFDENYNMHYFKLQKLDNLHYKGYITIDLLEILEDINSQGIYLNPQNCFYGNPNDPDLEFITFRNTDQGTYFMIDDFVIRGETPVYTYVGTGKEVTFPLTDHNFVVEASTYLFLSDNTNYNLTLTTDNPLIKLYLNGELVIDYDFVGNGTRKIEQLVTLNKGYNLLTLIISTTKFDEKNGWQIFDASFSLEGEAVKYQHFRKDVAWLSEEVQWKERFYDKIDWTWVKDFNYQGEPNAGPQKRYLVSRICTANPKNQIGLTLEHTVYDRATSHLFSKIGTGTIVLLGNDLPYSSSINNEQAVFLESLISYLLSENDIFSILKHEMLQAFLVNTQIRLYNELWDEYLADKDYTRGEAPSNYIRTDSILDDSGAAVDVNLPGLWKDVHSLVYLGFAYDPDDPYLLRAGRNFDKSLKLSILNDENWLYSLYEGRIDSEISFYDIFSTTTALDQNDITTFQLLRNNLRLFFNKFYTYDVTLTGDNVGRPEENFDWSDENEKWHCLWASWEKLPGFETLHTFFFSIEQKIDTEDGRYYVEFETRWNPFYTDNNEWYYAGGILDSKGFSVRIYDYTEILLTYNELEKQINQPTDTEGKPIFKPMLIENDLPAQITWFQFWNLISQYIIYRSETAKVTRPVSLKDALRNPAKIKDYSILSMIEDNMYRFERAVSYWQDKYFESKDNETIAYINGTREIYPDGVGSNDIVFTSKSLEDDLLNSILSRWMAYFSRRRSFYGKYMPIRLRILSLTDEDSKSPYSDKSRAYVQDRWTIENNEFHDPIMVRNIREEYTRLGLKFRRLDIMYLGDWREINVLGEHIIPPNSREYNGKLIYDLGIHNLVFKVRIVYADPITHDIYVNQFLITHRVIDYEKFNSFFQELANDEDLLNEYFVQGPNELFTGDVIPKNVPMIFILGDETNHATFREFIGLSENGLPLEKYKDLFIIDYKGEKLYPVFYCVMLDDGYRIFRYLCHVRIELDKNGKKRIIPALEFLNSAGRMPINKKILEDSSLHWLLYANGLPTNIPELNVRYAASVGGNKIEGILAKLEGIGVDINSLEFEEKNNKPVIKGYQNFGKQIWAKVDGTLACFDLTLEKKRIYDELMACDYDDPERKWEYVLNSKNEKVKLLVMTGKEFSILLPEHYYNKEDKNDPLNGQLLPGNRLLTNYFNNLFPDGPKQIGDSIEKDSYYIPDHVEIVDYTPEKENNYRVKLLSKYSFNFWRKSQDIGEYTVQSEIGGITQFLNHYQNDLVLARGISEFYANMKIKRSKGECEKFMERTKRHLLNELLASTPGAATVSEKSEEGRKRINALKLFTVKLGSQTYSLYDLLNPKQTVFRSFALVKALKTGVFARFRYYCSSLINGKSQQYSFPKEMNAVVAFTNFDEIINAYLVKLKEHAELLFKETTKPITNPLYAIMTNPATQSYKKSMFAVCGTVLLGKEKLKNLDYPKNSLQVFLTYDEYITTGQSFQAAFWSVSGQRTQKLNEDFYKMLSMLIKKTYQLKDEVKIPIVEKDINLLEINKMLKMLQASFIRKYRGNGITILKMNFDQKSKLFIPDALRGTSLGGFISVFSNYLSMLQDIIEFLPSNPELLLPILPLFITIIQILNYRSYGRLFDIYERKGSNVNKFKRYKVPLTSFYWVDMYAQALNIFDDFSENKDFYKVDVDEPIYQESHKGWYFWYYYIKESFMKNDERSLGRLCSFNIKIGDKTIKWQGFIERESFLSAYKRFCEDLMEYFATHPKSEFSSFKYRELADYLT
ncbi:MAG: hypothetical protein DRO63_02130, partial [Candidatus Gerdarchaeota archaeon]